MYTYRIRWKYTLVETSRIQKLFRIQKLCFGNWISYSDTTLAKLLFIVFRNYFLSHSEA